MGRINYRWQTSHCVTSDLPVDDTGERECDTGQIQVDSPCLSLMNEEKAVSPKDLDFAVAASESQGHTSAQSSRTPSERMNEKKEIKNAYKNIGA